MKDALLGYTGFVGSHLRENLSPETTLYFNSKNIRDAINGEFRNVYCACVPAVKWKANRYPQDDHDQVEDIKEILMSIRCSKMFLMSTIDIHDPYITGQTEMSVSGSFESYGRHRYDLEESLTRHFRDELFIVRLPALFGVGLKKNYLFDLMNDNNVCDININTKFQWYYLRWLWEDILSAVEAEHRVVNLYSDPVSTRDIVERFFPEKTSSLREGSHMEYAQDSLYGRRTSDHILAAMEDYMDIERVKGVDNHMAISNMAWKPEDDAHAAFLLPRYGIRYLEILPTKYAPWDDVFSSNLVNQLDIFNRAGISVYSVQSVFHGVDGRFGDAHVEEHLGKVVRFCEKIGAKVIVMGSPGMRGRGCSEEALGELLHRVSVGTEVRICLEPNSTAYGCSVGTTIDKCLAIRGNQDFSINYDTGNASMESDRLPCIRDYIGHIQISNSFLHPMRKGDYERIVQSGVCGSIHELLGDKKISLEVSLQNHTDLLGEQIRRFSRFNVLYFAL